MFIHLHTHSCYSFLEALPSPYELAQQAARLGMPALALTDHHSLTGALEFYQACRDAGIQPILGLELDMYPPDELGAALGGDLTLLAMDLNGWTSLCRLSSAVQHEAYNGGLSFARLSQDTAGLICLTGGMRSILDQFVCTGQPRLAEAYLDRLASLFPGRLYVELQPRSPEDENHLTRLALLAQRRKIPSVASADVYYLEPDDSHLQHLLAAMRLNCRLENVPASACAPPSAYFTSGEDMAPRFEHLPQALEMTVEIAARCELELPLGKPNYPALDLPPGKSPRQILRQKAEDGARRLYGEISTELQNRLDHELEVISSYGYDSLFLIMEEIIAFARSSGVPVSSRGSAASSLVAHCLGITSPDPLRLNLYFERFLNPARATPPDIDTDLCSRRRDEVIHFVYKRFGQQRVAMVGTINRFRRRSALREVAKAYGLPAAEIKKLTESLPHRWWGPHPAGEDPQRPFANLEEQYPAPHYQKIFQDAARIIGLPRHLSVHAGGVVIAPGPITDLVPTQMAPKGVVITQLDLEAVEKLGLVKIDLLGIRGLTVLGDVAERILEQRSSAAAPASIKSHQVESPLLGVLESIPEDDPLTAQMVRSAGTIGCFQIESPGMRATLREIQAASVDDIMVALALYRPGPLSGGLKDAFVRRHLGQEAVEQLHPALTSLLSDTYGVILYQEQVLRIAHELAGLSLADADLLRRAMSHFDPGERMKTLKEKFIHGVWVHNQVPEATAERIWELMAAFAGYGFPKAHAASYAQIGWRAAWCKAHFPAVFMAAVLANWGGYYSQRVYLTEARRRGMVLRPPHINFARREFTVRYLDGEAILFMGLDQVKELTRRTQLRIMRERPFRTLEDFLVRVDPRPVEAENLVRVGALAGMGTIPALLSSLKPGGWRGGQMFLFPFESISGEESGVQDWTREQKVAAQEAILGAGVDAHRLELFADQIAAARALNTLDAASRVGKRVLVAGMRQTWRRSRTAGGDPIYFMSLEDLEGMLEVVILSDVYRRGRAALSEVGPYLVEGLVDIDRTSGEPFIRAERIRLLK